ncbi:hypothetical protein FA13DRAFT_1713935 [Coprinellus micaceus]|uniref:Uncharacterized protein n=1 Tax=Coprinellus micaceus TaxID=71717 RepID=A0A4Y7SUN6_COPMI|nr:hypothetical protein FA13DRAFT_1713935 [Coprinellus micaceus]
MSALCTFSSNPTPWNGFPIKRLCCPTVADRQSEDVHQVSADSVKDWWGNPRFCVLEGQKYWPTPKSACKFTKNSAIDSLSEEGSVPKVSKSSNEPFRRKKFRKFDLKWKFDGWEAAALDTGVTGGGSSGHPMKTTLSKAIPGEVQCENFYLGPQPVKGLANLGCEVTKNAGERGQNFGHPQKMHGKISE